MVEESGIVQLPDHDKGNLAPFVYEKIIFSHTHFNSTRSIEEISDLRSRELELLTNGSSFSCTIIAIYFSKDPATALYLTEMLDLAFKLGAVLENELSDAFYLSFRPPFFNSQDHSIQHALNCAMQLLGAYNDKIPQLKLGMHYGELAYRILPEMSDSYNLVGNAIAAIILMLGNVSEGRIAFSADSKIAEYYSSKLISVHGNWSNSIVDISKKGYNFYKHLSTIYPTKPH